MNEIPTLAVYDGDLLKLLKAKDIMYCTADGAYTHLYLMSGKKVVISKNLKSITCNLPESHFMRVHNSVVVNLAHAVAFQNGNYNMLHMSNGEEIAISRNKKSEFLDRFVKL